MKTKLRRTDFWLSKIIIAPTPETWIFILKTGQNQTGDGKSETDPHQNCLVLSVHTTNLTRQDSFVTSPIVFTPPTQTLGQDETKLSCQRCEQASKF